MQKMEQQPSSLILTPLQTREILHFSASKESKYPQKISLLDVFLFQLKIFGSLASGKETCSYNLLLCSLRYHCVNTVFHFVQTNAILPVLFNFVFTATTLCFDATSIAPFFLQVK